MNVGVCTALFSFSFFEEESVCFFFTVGIQWMMQNGEISWTGVDRGRGTQAGRCFQVLTKAVGMREYGTVVMLFQASSVGS